MIEILFGGGRTEDRNTEFVFVRGLEPIRFLQHAAGVVLGDHKTQIHVKMKKQRILKNGAL